MRWLLRIVLALMVGVVLALVLGYFAIRRELPAVPLRAQLDEQDVLRLREVVGRVGDPRKIAPGTVQTLTLTQSEIDAAAKLATSKVEKTGVQAIATAEGLRLQLSRVSPFPNLTPYLDIEFTASGQAASPQVSEVRLGALPLPDGVAQEAFNEALQRLRSYSKDISELIDAVEALRYRDGELEIAFRVSGTLAKRLEGTGRGLLTTQLGPERVKDYHEAMRSALRGSRMGRPIKISTLLGPLFRRMRARADPEAVAEARALFLVATLYAVGRSPRDVVDVEVKPLPRRKVRIWGREDLPKHFLVSAFVAAWGDQALADALGLSKELTDAEEGGSGFSFVDLAADRAGTQLFERGFSSPEHRVELMSRLSDPRFADAELLPDPRDLPEGLTEAQLEASGKAPGTEGYEALVRKMDERLKATPLHQALLAR